MENHNTTRASIGRGLQRQPSPSTVNTAGVESRPPPVHALSHLTASPRAASSPEVINLTALLERRNAEVVQLTTQKDSANRDLKRHFDDELRHSNAEHDRELKAARAEGRRYKEEVVTLTHRLGESATAKRRHEEVVTELQAETGDLEARLLKQESITDQYKAEKTVLSRQLATVSEEKIEFVVQNSAPPPIIEMRDAWTGMTKADVPSSPSPSPSDCRNRTIVRALYNTLHDTPKLEGYIDALDTTSSKQLMASMEGVDGKEIGDEVSDHLLRQMGEDSDE